MFDAAGNRDSRLVESTTDGTVNASSTARLTKSLLTIPPSKLRGGSILKWRFHISKTAAGTGDLVFDVRVGTNGTAADPSIFSFTITGQTAVVDDAIVEIVVICRGPLSASGIFQGSFLLMHNLLATGFGVVPVIVQKAQSSVFDVTTASLLACVSLTTPASTVITIHQTIGEMLNI